MKESVGRHLEQAFADSRNWKGVNEFVRMGMVGLLDLVKQYRSAAQELEREVNGKASKNEVAGQLAGKLAMSDFAQLHERYSTEKTLANGLSRVELDLKAKMEDLSIEVNRCRTANEVLESAQSDTIIRIKQLKEQEQRFACDTNRRLQAILLSKADRTEIDGLCRLNQTFERELQQLQQSVVDLSKRTFQSQIQQLTEKLNQQEEIGQMTAQAHESFRTRIESTIGRMQQELATVSGSKTKLAEELVGILARQQEQKRAEQENTYRDTVKQRETLEQLNNRNATVVKQLETVTSRLETLELRENNFNKLRLDCSKEFSRLNDLEQIIDELQRKQQPDSSDSTTKILQALTETFDDELQKKVKQLKQNLELKLSGMESQLVKKSQLQQHLQAKLDQTQFESSLRGFMQTIADVDGRHHRLLDKLDLLHEEFLNFKLNQSRLNETFAQAVDTKVTSEQMQQALAPLVSYADLKLVVTELTKKLEACAQREKFVRFAHDQATINETLCSENILGRWLWNGQQLRNGNLVPWERQVINTLPQNFIWEDNTPTLIISNGGLYQIELGFYSRKKPTVQIIINGSVVISAVNSNSYVVHHSSGKLKQHRSKDHPVGGLTLIDYFLLPARARFAVSYSGEELGEGFISIRRL